jgi:hypothetical protein
MLLVPKLAASRPANSRAINYSIQLYNAISSKSFVKIQSAVSKTFLQYHNIRKIIWFWQLWAAAHDLEVAAIDFLINSLF